MRLVKIIPIYDKGVVKVKEKGKKPYYVFLPMIDKYRNFSLSVVKELCKHLFNEVKYIEEINPNIYNLLTPIENLHTPTDLLKMMSKRNIKLRNVALKVSKPKERLIERYKLLKELDFWIIFYYRGNSWITSMMTWNQRGLNGLEEEVRALGEELTSILLEIYNQGYFLKLRGGFNEESIRELLNKYFPWKEKSEDLKKKESEKMREPIIKIKKKVERKIKPKEKIKKIKSKKKKKVEVVKKEVPYETIERKVKRFLKSEPINFFDRVVKSKINQLKIEELNENQRKELYKLIYEYLCSRNVEAQRKFVREVNLKFMNLLPYGIYYK